MILRPLLSALLGLVLLSGCSHPSPRVIFHTLRPLAVDEARPVPAQQPMALEIMPVQLPELLLRSQIVVLEGQDSQRLSANHRWGNTLEKDMQRVLAENLSALLGSDAVVQYPLGTQVKALYRITLDVQQCEGTVGGTLQFRATWLVTQPGDGRLLLLRRSSLQEPLKNGSVEELVAAHSRVLNRLSQEIASVLQELRSKGN